MPPLGAGASFELCWVLRVICLAYKQAVVAESDSSLLSQERVSDYVISLRCGGRQGSSLRSDELRDHKTVASPLTAFLAAAHG